MNLTSSVSCILGNTIKWDNSEEQALYSNQKHNGIPKLFILRYRFPFFLFTFVISLCCLYYWSRPISTLWTGSPIQAPFLNTYISKFLCTALFSVTSTLSLFAAFLFVVITTLYLLCIPFVPPVDAVANPASAAFYQSPKKLLCFKRLFKQKKCTSVPVFGPGKHHNVLFCSPLVSPFPSLNSIKNSRTMYIFFKSSVAYYTCKHAAQALPEAKGN